jgi:hypothetical protein
MIAGTNQATTTKQGAGFIVSPEDDLIDLEGASTSAFNTEFDPSQVEQQQA